MSFETIMQKVTGVFSGAAFRGCSADPRFMDVSPRRREPFFKEGDVWLSKNMDEINLIVVIASTYPTTPSQLIVYYFHPGEVPKETGTIDLDAFLNQYRRDSNRSVYNFRTNKCELP